MCRGYYAILDVPSDASKSLIQAAFRGQAMRYHPDRVEESQKQDAVKRFQALQEAYSVLRDPVKRRQYDSGG